MNRSKYSGFTLLELVAAISVATALMLTCGVIMKMGVQEQVTVSRELVWEREANLLVEHISADLAIAHRGYWYEGKKSAYCSFGWFVLRPLSAQNRSQAIGDLCSVGYALRDLKSEKGPDDVVRSLVRVQHDSAVVFDAIAADREDVLWQLSEEGERGEPLVAGVLVFELWPMLRDGLEAWQPWHPELRSMPEAVELRVVLASSALQARLRTSDDWDLAKLKIKQLGGDEIRELRTLIYLGPHAD
mgnify:CR=1 FL=1